MPEVSLRKVVTRKLNDFCCTACHSPILSFSSIRSDTNTSIFPKYHATRQPTCQAVANTNANDPSLSYKVTPQVEFVGKSAPETTGKQHYAVSLTAGSLPDTKARAPIDVVVAMDISGSMSSNNKLNLCKKTCEILVNELGNDDQFGLSLFSTNVRVAFPLQKMNATNKGRALAVIAAIRTEGQTNLSGGLTSAIGELQGSTSKNEVRSIMLLTDGHANQGVTEPRAVIDLTKACLASTPNISVNVFGYGCDHNAELLRKISEASVTKGSYYFIESNDNVSSAFGDCLGGLMSVAAQNITITISGENIKVLYDTVVTKSTGTYEINLGDMFAEESKDVVVEVENLGDGDQHEITAIVSYIDIFSMRPVKAEPESGVILRPKGTEVAPTNSHVALQIMRITVAKAMAEANLLGQRGDMAGGRQIITQQLAAIASLSASFKPTEADQLVINSFLSDLNEAIATMNTSVQEYAYRGSKNMCKKMQGHAMQRSNEESEETENLYRGSAKSAMACKMKMNSMSPAILHAIHGSVSRRPPPPNGPPPPRSLAPPPPSGKPISAPQTSSGIPPSPLKATPPPVSVGLG